MREVLPTEEEPIQAIFIKGKRSQTFILQSNVFIYHTKANTFIKTHKKTKDTNKENHT